MWAEPLLHKMAESSAVMESVLVAIQEAEWPGKSVAEFLLFA